MASLAHSVWLSTCGLGWLPQSCRWEQSAPLVPCCELRLVPTMLVSMRDMQGCPSWIDLCKNKDGCWGGGAAKDGGGEAQASPWRPQTPSLGYRQRQPLVLGCKTRRQLLGFSSATQ